MIQPGARPFGPSFTGDFFFFEAGDFFDAAVAFEEAEALAFFAFGAGEASNSLPELAEAEGATVVRLRGGMVAVKRGQKRGRGAGRATTTAQEQQRRSSSSIGRRECRALEREREEKKHQSIEKLQKGSPARSPQE